MKRFFQKYNVIIENTASTTVFLENRLEAFWVAILILKLGTPKIPPSGKSWKTEFNAEDHSRRKITITK